MYRIVLFLSTGPDQMTFEKQYDFKDTFELSDHDPLILLKHNRYETTKFTPKQNKMRNSKQRQVPQQHPPKEYFTRFLLTATSSITIEHLTENKPFRPWFGSLMRSELCMLAWCSMFLTNELKTYRFFFFENDNEAFFRLYSATLMFSILMFYIFAKNLFAKTK